MKRKLFSAILFGALLTASTSGLTSCKDYDDDISNLQSQIDKLATADQLSAKVSEMQAAISAAQSAAEAKAAAAQTVADAAKAAAGDAAAAAKAAQSTADAAAAAAAEVQKAADKAIADLEAKAATKDELKAAADAAAAAVKAIEDAHAADKAEIEAAIETGLDAVKAEIAATNEKLAELATRLDAVEAKLAALEAGEGQEEVLAAIQAEVEAISDALEDIIGEYTSMVTDVNLYVSGDVKQDNVLRFVYVSQERDTKFPAAEGVADAQIEFSSKNKNVMTTDKLLVRVSPTNAVLNAANISLLNSQGADLSDYVEVKAVKPFEELILGKTRAAEGNGLWEVEFKVKDGVDAAKFADAVTVKEGLTTYGIKYAVAVQNTESDETRRVISAYDVEVLPEDYEPASNDIEVTNRDGYYTSISNIRNRYYYKDPKKPGDIVAENNTVPNEASELAWVNKPDVAGGSEPTVQDESDSRSSKNTACKLIDVEIGKSIDIFVGREDNPKNETSDVVKGFYVTLDSDNAIESAPSEINAWESYSYTNVGVPGDSKRPAKMFYGNEGSISIDSPAALGDIIGFRVYVVNLDGTLVDPDGRAFYVAVGKEKVVAEITSSEVVAKINPTKPDTYEYHFTVGDKNYYGEAPLTAEGVKYCEKIEDGWTITANASAYGNNSIDPEYGKDYTIEFIDKNSDGKKDVAKVTILNPLKFIDEGVYTAQATAENENGTEICDFSITFKKTMPTAAPVLAWNSTYDPALQVFANTGKNSPNIYKLESVGGSSDIQAIELNEILQDLTYGHKIANSSYYTLVFKDVTVNANGATKDFVSPVGTTVSENAPVNTDLYQVSKYMVTTDGETGKFGVNAIDKKSHEIAYNYNFGKISLTRNYQTAKYTEAPWVKNAEKNLAMTFASWIDYESVAFASAKSFKYLPGVADNNAGTIKLGSTSAGQKDTTTVWSVSSDVILNIDLKPIKSTSNVTINRVYRKRNGSFYLWFRDIEKWARKDNGGNLAKDVDDKALSDYGIKLDMEKDLTEGATYVKYTEAEGTETIEYLVKTAEQDEVSSSGTVTKPAVKFFKRISNGDYYRVAYDKASNSYKFCDVAGNVLNNQNEGNVIDNAKIAAQAACKLANGAKMAPVYVYTVSITQKPGTSSDLVAWNSVIRNYNKDGVAIFGSSSAKVDFGSLVGTYVNIVDVRTADNDPFEADWNKVTNEVKLVQRAGTLNPGNKGTLIIKVSDCFGHTNEWKLEYAIEQ